MALATSLRTRCRNGMKIIDRVTGKSSLITVKDYGHGSACILIHDAEDNFELERIKSDKIEEEIIAHGGRVFDDDNRGNQ